MADYSPMSRDEKLLRKLLGQSIQTEPPQSRIEFLLQEIIDGGGIGGGSYKIKDQYDTLAELEAAHPTGADGDAYLVGDPTHIYVWLDDRQEYADGGLFAAVPGLDGVGIQSIEKTSTSGLVDTYTITYTDGDTDTFTVTNGEQGVGITDISKTSTVGKVDTYTITLSNGDTYDFTVTNGEGVGVPEGGTTGQVLVKKSNTDYDTEWANAGAGEGVPAGGTTGQILAKKTGADYDTEWVDNEGGSDVTSELESLSAAASELASETGSLESENSVQTSEIASQTSEINSLASENSAQSSELASLSSSMSEVVSEISSMSVSDISSQLNSLSAENSTQTSEIGSLSQSMSELASAAASTSTSQSGIDSEQDVAIASLTSENSTQTSEIGSLASEIDSMSTSDYTSEINSLHSETSELAVENSTQTSEIGSLGVSMSELADAAASTSTSQSEIDSTQNVSLASLSTENSTQTSEIGSLSTASSELASEVEVIGSEVAEKQDVLTAGSGIDITGDIISIDTDIYVDTPLGTIIPYGGTTAPTGFLVCDGSAVSRATYAQLFAVIGTKYGEGDGSATFNLPDAEAGTIVYPSNEVGGISGSIYIIKATQTALPSDFSSILTANSNLFQASYQNGQYGFEIDGTFYAIGGGGGGSTAGCVKYDENFTGLTVEEFAHLGISQS